MKDPSTSVLQDRFRPLAIGHVGSARVYSVDGQLHPHQHEQPDKWSRPCPLRHVVEIHPPLFVPKKKYQQVNVRRAEKLPLFPDCYFLMMPNILRRRVEQPFAT